ncbi:MAG: hypothetical protein JW830_15235 [Bacteroidales bacterium]|nr:hypothetical protein [Bacteroidales bacterium]
MKTQTNNLKKIAATACVALLIATGSYTQSDAGYSDSELVSLVNLETLISLAEKSIRYTAPAIAESEVYYAEFERLNTLAEATEASLKYEAPAADVNEVTVEKERLEWLASATEASLKYNAPEADNFNEIENQNVTMIASTK